MSCDLGQLGWNFDSTDFLYPFPSDVSDDDFSMRKRLKTNEKKSNTIEVELKLLSPIEFSVQTSNMNSTFSDTILKANKNFKYFKNNKFTNLYEMNIKHYFYVLSRIKYLHSDCYMTVNYNHFDNTFIKALIKNLSPNDNILSFIQSSKNIQKSILESLELDPKFGKSMKSMFNYHMFEDLYPHQTIAFYMSVIRNGKSILSDKLGKSLTAITIMTYFRDDWPLVIVCDKERKKYWSDELTEAYRYCQNLYRICVVNGVNDIYVYPNPFHDIMIIDYELYYEIKDTLSFINLNIKAFVFEDQCRGSNTNSRQWKGLSQCVENLKNALRVIFISSKIVNSDKYHRLWPLLNILDPEVYNDYEQFESRYCDEEHSKRGQMIQEFQILLRSTFLISDLVAE